MGTMYICSEIYVKKLGCVQSRLETFREAACAVQGHGAEASRKVCVKLILNAPKKSPVQKRPFHGRMQKDRWPLMG